MNEIKSKRYPGLIKQAVKLHAEVEEKGWKLAEVIFETVEILRGEGFVVSDHKNPARLTAARRVATDMGIGHFTIEVYHRLWKKYGDPKQRDASLTFGDHVEIVKHPTWIESVRKRRAELAKQPLQKRVGVTASPSYPYQHLSTAKSALRRVTNSNIWDYDDREKALAYAQEIQQLAQEVLVKFGGQKDAKPATRRRIKAAA